ncbi:MAG: IS200/IS605 family accessory protein TnpB-related protein [Gloeomargarita sp. SKYG98]|nr:IS200/IS605 family accessory protein TnpB-related protein [Gloeomargarita sp. SKYG98]
MWSVVHQAFSYQARVATTPEQHEVLSAYAELFGRVERSLFAALAAGRDKNQTGRAFLQRFGITGRQLNSARVELEGRLRAVKESQVTQVEQLQQKIRKAQQIIKKEKRRFVLHQKKRRLAKLQSQLARLEADRRTGKIRLCFGSRRLFHKQFALVDNGYGSHAEWLADWQFARSNQFFVVGCQNETAGNQSCQAVPETDGTFTLYLRVPDAFVERFANCLSPGLQQRGKKAYLKLTGIRFAYGQEQILQALQGVKVLTTTRSGKATTKRIGTPVNYRFVLDERGWRVIVSIGRSQPERVTNLAAGAIGVDINGDHLAVTEMDRYGNWVASWRFDLPLYGKTTGQAQAMILEACTQVAQLAAEKGKPLVVEELNFQRKRAQLESESPRRCRQLSSFAYRKILTGLKSAAFRAGVEVCEVNPAYSSIIGAVNYARKLGISPHLAAALVLARRVLRLSERPACQGTITVPWRGGHVTFSLPARNREKHVWSFWRGVAQALAAVVPQSLSRASLRPPPVEADRPPGHLLADTWPECSSDLSVGFRHAPLLQVAGEVAGRAVCPAACG